MAIKESEQCFVNPYHFVQLDSRGCLRESCDDVRGPLSGWIECSLTTLTPLFVPNSSNNDILRKRDKKNNLIKSYDFFSYTDLSAHADGSNPPSPCPVIPGSELRGVIRSVYETLTRSCMSSIDEDRVFYRRTPIPGKPGLLSKVGGHWQLQPCVRYGVAISRTGQDCHNFSALVDNLKDGRPVWIKQGGYYTKTIKGKPNKDGTPGEDKIIKLFPFVSDISPELVTNYTPGIFHRASMPVTGHKHHESVFVRDRDTTKSPMSVDSDAIERLKFSVATYKELDESYTDYPDIEKVTTDIPVYYAEYNHVLYLSPAAIGREVFKNRIDSILSQGGQYEPCTDVARLCPACRLFGMVRRGGDNNGTAAGIAGRVRFSDAVLKKKPDDLKTLFHDWVRLPELASPKPSAAEFYLRPFTNAHLWNYDYAGKWQPGQGGKLKLGSLPGYNPAIRGRKYYWHQHIINPPQHIADATERNVIVRCLRKGQVFTFRVYFNEVTQQELDRLLWVLSVGRHMVSDHPTHALKIGMGKPLGLGSVRIVPEKVVIRELKKDGGISYRLTQNENPLADFDWTTPEKELALLGCSSGVLQDFLRLANWEQAPAGVDYPHTEEHPHDESYQWFVDNRLIRPGSAFTPVIKQSLPSNPACPGLKKYKEQ